MAKLELRFRLSKSDSQTLARVQKVAVPPPTPDDPSTRAIHFLRGASGRASICLSAFYLFLGAEASTEEQRRDWTHVQRVKHYTVRFAAIGTLALCIRAIFDSGKVGLGPKTVVTLSPKAFEKVAAYWANGNLRKEQEARCALTLVQKVFSRCAVSISEAKKSRCILTRRVALLKAYADRESAHISLHNYAFDLHDVVHVVAATALLGAVIDRFDRRGDTEANYLVDIDPAAYTAAVEVFPELSTAPRLFKDVDVHRMLQGLYTGKMFDGVDYLSTWLPSVLGLDDLPKEFASLFQSMQPPEPSVK